ncbi:hypothetical protein [Streptomyces bambusae]|uniref:Uncharacterized protein n=1 Tax=Streptomyces bambusae TaxID=1550616 RepID=A0ABS6ZA96_9ACTN|nr:hypothetical protein [Streptomyces bambusae]MBW5484675.1 hypothetical protein [Streptomyces bambusae]
MKANILRIAPMAALVTAALLTAGATASAATLPQQEPASVAVQPTARYGPYPSSQACHQAGKKGQDQGRWKHYTCKQEKPHKWYLHTSK